MTNALAKIKTARDNEQKEIVTKFKTVGDCMERVMLGLETGAMERIEQIETINAAGKLINAQRGILEVHKLQMIAEKIAS